MFVEALPEWLALDLPCALLSLAFYLHKGATFFLNKSSQKNNPLMSIVDFVGPKTWFASSKSTMRKSDVHGTWYLMREARWNTTSPTPAYSVSSVCGQTNSCSTSRSVFTVVTFSAKKEGRIARSCVIPNQTVSFGQLRTSSWISVAVHFPRFDSCVCLRDHAYGSLLHYSLSKIAIVISCIQHQICKINPFLWKVKLTW